MKLKQMSASLFATILLLLILEIITTALVPALGIHKYKLAFHLLIVLFIGFKVETPFLPIMILIIQLFHSAFTIEGWAYGTFAGVLVCIIIGYVKDLLDFSSTASTIVLTEIFQVVWFIIVAILIYLRLDSFDYILARLWRFIPESILLSLLSPFFFSLLDRIWKISDKGEGIGAKI